MKTIQLGDTGTDVQKWQAFLATHGFPSITADAIFGIRTAEATAEWQSGHQLFADGIVGPKTWAHAGFVDEAPEPPAEATAPNPWPLEADAEAFYGYPPSLTQVEPPFPMFFEGQKISAITCHVKVATSLRRVLQKIKDGFASADALHAARADVYDGMYNDRNVRGSSHRSMHAYGAAIDLDAEHNAFYSGHGTMSPIVVAAFKSEGWRWGGDYSGRTDPMHFECCR